METEKKQLLDNMTYKIRYIYNTEKDDNQRYVKIYLLLEEIYSLGKKSNKKEDKNNMDTICKFGDSDLEYEEDDFEGTVEFTAENVTEYEFEVSKDVKKTIYHSLSVRFRPRLGKPGPVKYLIKNGKVCE